MKLKIKKGDTVQVVAGADKGKKGSVLDLDRTKLKVRVQGVAEKTHYSDKDGLTKIEGFINYSNVKLVQAAAQAKKKTSKKAAATK